MVPIQAYLAGLGQYLSGVNAPLNQQTNAKQYGVVGASVAGGEFFGSNVLPQAIDGDRGIQSIIRDAQSMGVAPPFSSNALTVLILSKGFSVKGLPVSYHSSVSSSAFYAVLEAPAVDQMATIAREIINASTDPAGLGPAANAWGAPAVLPVNLGGEVADYCVRPDASGPEYVWQGTVTLGGAQFSASAKVSIGARDNSSDGACSVSGYTKSIPLDTVRARGAGRFGGSAPAGIFRSAAGPAGQNEVFVSGSGWVDVLSSTGSSFIYQQWLAGPFWGSNGTLVGDMDKDGTADLIALANGRVDVLRSAGNHFYPPETWSLHTFVGNVATLLGDVDGDQRADLVAVAEDYIGVLRSTGAGFGPYELFSDPGLPPDHGALMADVHGDGYADLVDLAPDHVGIRRPNTRACPPAGQKCELQAQGFLPSQTWFDFEFYGALGVAAGDVNGDGFADLVSFGSGYVGVLLSNGSDSFHYEQWSIETMAGNSSAVLADVNDDGKDDVVVSTGAGVVVRLSTPVGRGTPGTRFGSAQTWYVGSF
jgi:hypothetical protein